MQARDIRDLPSTSKRRMVLFASTPCYRYGGTVCTAKSFQLPDGSDMAACSVIGALRLIPAGFYKKNAKTFTITIDRIL